MCCSPNREAVRVATHYYTRAWANVKTQETNVISSLFFFFLFCFLLFFGFFFLLLLFLFFCFFADDFLAGAGFNGINALASRVSTVFQPCGTLLSQCDILEIHVCQGNGQRVLSITTRRFYTEKA